MKMEDIEELMDRANKKLDKSLKWNNIAMWIFFICMSLNILFFIFF